ncbi:pyridoxal phosphate-dependent aminotransferase [Ammoniphilus resinae]|uniref:Aminotransferase n=1 Tax=Ammoniphilus resinae TaxID=861532 RepID=A0ABS4GLT8_9BACL|nr:pyridoxal phosphate-dependent aminotransferase [Ammoniphilus resinae]MBP1931216.1 aspartate aminotransferase/aminotransferase [Ammoniphilus resinae]
MKSFAKSRERIPMNSIREIMNMAEGMSDVIQLQIGEPAAETPVHIRQAAIRAMEEGYTHYTSNAGLLSLREAISRRMERDYQVQVGTERIIITAGAVAALNLALLSLVEVGEEVLIPDPTYPNYESLVRMQGAIPVYYPTNAADGYLPDLQALEDRITPYTKAMIINSPSNPTGAVFTKEVWLGVLELAKKHDIYLISDEIYDELIYEGEHICPLSLAPELEDRIISIFGFSKAYAMTGWRLAYALVPENLFNLMCKLQEPVTTCASSISQKAGEAALDGSSEFVTTMRKEYREKRDAACDILDRYEIDYNKPKGAFYILIDISKTGVTARDFAIQLLKQEKVAVAPCGVFGPSGKHLIRVCFAGDRSLLEEGIHRIGQFYQGFFEK